jgi:hypothetical protein
MDNKNCCQPTDNQKKGLLSVLFYALIPHVFCIGFIIFSVIGVSAATLAFKKFLMTPYLFQSLIAISFLFTTISAGIYLKKSGCLSAEGIKNKLKYLSTMYATTITVNLLLFLVIFPALANFKSADNFTNEANLISMSMEVKIPCSGHAPLVIDELEKNGGVDMVRFKLPNIFEIKYNAEKTSPEKITSLEIFKTYKASIQ